MLPLITHPALCSCVHAEAQHDAQRNNDRLNEASHPNLSRDLRQGRWRPAALTRNGSCRWRRTKFRRAAGSFPFLVALAPVPGLVALRERFALSRLSPHPGAMANAIADAALGRSNPWAFENIRSQPRFQSAVRD